MLKIRNSLTIICSYDKVIMMINIPPKENRFMKKILALVLSLLTVSSVLASCSGERAAEKYSPKITVSSSDAAESAAWLTEKLGDRLTDEVLSLIHI